MKQSRIKHHVSIISTEDLEFCLTSVSDMYFRDSEGQSNGVGKKILVSEVTIMMEEHTGNSLSLPEFIQNL